MSPRPKSASLRSMNMCPVPLRESTDVRKFAVLEGQYFGKFLPWDSLVIMLDLRLESSYRLHNTWNKIVHQPHLLFTEATTRNIFVLFEQEEVTSCQIGANSCHKTCDIPPWVAKNWTTHPLSTAQKRMTHPHLCSGPLPPPPAPTQYFLIKPVVFFQN